MADAFDLSIVIVNYNSRDYLKRCLDSIYSHETHLALEVIVVDNGSQDDSIRQVRNHFAQIRLIENKRNEGFIKAANEGIRASRGKYIFSLNNDTLIFPDTLEELVHFLDAHPEAGACGPLVLNGDGTIQRQCKRAWPTLWNSLTYHAGLWRLFPKNKYWRKHFGGYFLLDRPDDQVCEVDQISGAAMMIRASLLNSVGFMDENYVMYWDDSDWCFRAKKAGWKIYYVPSAKMIHFGGATGSRFHTFRNLFHFHRGGILFYRRYLAPRHFFLINHLYYAGIWFAFVYKLFLNFFRKEKIIGSRKPSS